MKYLKLTFEDISQKNILYYDKEVELACFNICEALKIDNMPDYDSTHYFELENNQFYQKPIGLENRLSSDDRIFDSNMIEKFRSNKHNVLFVFKGRVLTGIVHFSDYNQTTVLQAIQEDVLTFERRMRQYLYLKDFRNEHLIEYFKYRSKKDKNSERFYSGRIANFEKNKDSFNQLGEFQLFDLKDLLEFGNSSKSGKVFKTQNSKDIQEIELITKVRNMAMHGKNPIEKHQESSVYSMESLDQLFQSLEILRNFTYRVEENIAKHHDYKKSTKLDNQSKLEIIHQHHPKALNYFIGH